MSSDLRWIYLVVFCVMFCRSVFVLLTIVFPVLRFTVSSSFWPLYCLFFDLRLMFPSLVSSNFWPLCCLSFNLRLLVPPLVSSDFWPLCCLFFDIRILITLSYLQFFFLIVVFACVLIGKHINWIVCSYQIIKVRHEPNIDDLNTMQK